MQGALTSQRLFDLWGQFILLFTTTTIRLSFYIYPFPCNDSQMSHTPDSVHVRGSDTQLHLQKLSLQQPDPLKAFPQTTSSPILLSGTGKALKTISPHKIKDKRKEKDTNKDKNFHQKLCQQALESEGFSNICND